MHSRIESIVKELRRGLEQHYGSRLYRVMLYGSQARGDAGFGSDVDVLVVLEGTVDAGAEIQATSRISADLSLAHDLVVCCVFVSRDDFQKCEWPLLMNVRAEGIAI